MEPEPRLNMDVPSTAALAPGAHPDERGTTFVVLTTTAKRVEVRLFDDRQRPIKTAALDRQDAMRFVGRLEGVKEGALYKFVLDGDEVPDPYARFLPFGVHGPARALAPRTELALPSPVPPHRWTIYELHVGTFSAAGTYRGAIEHLDALVDLGVTAIELLPLAAFNGARGWGYDGVALYAPHAPYGEPDDLRALVQAAHARGLAVILDVVYNHFGPAGNYLSRYAPEYFTSEVQTPWGDAPSFGWEPMRRLVLDNVRYWLDELGFDGLRLDATHAIHDASQPHILQEVSDIVHARGRRVFFEDERNEPDVVSKLGADGVWADDFHHQVHALLTGERDGYYAAYEPTVEALATNIQQGWTFSGEPYAPWEGRPRGKPATSLGREQLVTCIQNHDQIGNRAFGTRLSEHCSLDAFCAAAMLSLFLPTTPLLFMGQEWAATTPFLFFSDHGGDLGEAVSNGRREEFKSFAAFADAEMRARIPDPEAPSTFESSRLRRDEREVGDHARVVELHRTMLHLRQTDPVLSSPCPPGELEARVLADGILEVARRDGARERRLVVDFGGAPEANLIPDGARVLVESPSFGGGRRAILLAIDPADEKSSAKS